MSIGGPGWFERAMTETPEEREFFATARATQNEWRAEESRRIAQRLEKRANNVATQTFAPEGRYAYEFDQYGFELRTPHTTYIFDDEARLLRVRIKAATRRL